MHVCGNYKYIHIANYMYISIYIACAMFVRNETYVCLCLCEKRRMLGKFAYIRYKLHLYIFIACAMFVRKETYLWRKRPVCVKIGVYVREIYIHTWQIQQINILHVRYLCGKRLICEERGWRVRKEAYLWGRIPIFEKRTLCVRKETCLCGKRPICVERGLCVWI